ncbi:MAG: DUF547 domain-containing protein [Erythrobacter sp.]|uniref:DUF547 domain-containing protein n=1 Tax=Erythrobacter sp. TaxID=1042 RepID=UPI0026062EDB|nr:DUF547 domain-containing protein [Erythrobacter sp.]MDJ0979736.1 DUF547 domain-containing protein [Erythrobacter sp.]
MGFVRSSSVHLTTLAVCALAVAPAGAQEPGTPFATFAPGAATNTNSIDYDVWDEAVKKIVISMGPSLRQTAGRPPDGYGTRRVYGHTSRYRLEGSRVTFSFLDATIIGNLAQYRQDLQMVGDKVDLQSLSRNEQLAFWLNLHNVAMVEQIGSAWPVRQPRSLEIDGVPLDDAKFITVEGVALSLRDIREKIVFAHWRDPSVIYGFWRGDIGGPSIQREAYTGDNVRRLLERGANEFVNSLRGTQKQGGELQVATLYEEYAAFYFPDFETDLRAHLAKYAKEDVASILADTSRTKAVIKEYDIADLAGGAREPSYSFIEDANGRAQSFRIPRAMGALLAQREEKFRRIMKEGRTGTVTFSEIELPDEEGKKDEVE